MGRANPSVMTDHEASRTLVKSPPELWAECSEAASLARHLGEFGEIKITRLDPESTVAWEGERANGTVRIEPSAWGTRVTLTAQVEGTVEGEAVATPPPTPVRPELAPPAPPPREPERRPDPVPTPTSVAPRGLLARLKMRLAVQPETTAPPSDGALKPEPVKPEPVAPDPPLPPEPAARGLDAEAVLTAALDSLGSAHHRPYSRA